MIFRRYCRIPKVHLYKRVPGILQKSPCKDLNPCNVALAGTGEAAGGQGVPELAGERAREVWGLT
jgi:hypothetical protein